MFSSSVGVVTNNATIQSECRLKRVNTPHCGKGHLINHYTNSTIVGRSNLKNSQEEQNQCYYADSFTTPKVTVFSTQRDYPLNYGAASTSFSVYPRASSSLHHQPSAITDGMLKVELSLVVHCRSWHL